MSRHRADPRARTGLRAEHLPGATTFLLPELSNFPYGKHDDLVDSTTMALSFLRRMGYVRTDAEIKAAELDRVAHRAPRKLLYDV